MEETQTIAEKLKQALDDYTSYNGQNLNPVFLYMKEAERVLKTNEDSGNSKKLENLVLACKRKIVENNWGLIIKIAKFYCDLTKEKSSYDDFVSEGVIGLLNAIPKYQLERGKFSNYAGTAIRQNIIRKMQEILENIRLPINLFYNQEYMDYFFKLFKEKHGRIPNDKELADFSGKEVGRIKTLRGVNNLSRTFSLDAESYKNDEEGSCLLDYVDYYRDCPMEEGVINKMNYQELIKRINELFNKKQRIILIKRLEGKTLEEIGLEENLTKERIRQIENKAILKLRERKGELHR